MVGNAAPQLNIRYPFKAGRSLRGRSGREMLALKFTEIPDKVSKNQAGTLLRQAEKVTVQLATQDGGSSVQFVGNRRVHNVELTKDDYVMVFANGKMWLERMADYFYGVRPVDTAKSARPPLNLPTVEEDDLVRDPDSWMPQCDSPITPEEDVRVNSTPAKRMMVTGGRINGTGAKTVGMKSVAGKGLSEGRRRQSSNSDSEDGSDGSSSEEDSDSDSDDSGDDSDSGGEYTDRSSDEE